jgi:hypothetical protein
MKVRLTKESDQRHHLEVVRRDGSHDRRSLVTRELLFHDLLHFSVETEARLQGGFYGRLARGESLSVVDATAQADVNDPLSEIAIVERTVGMVTGLLKSEPPDEPKLLTVDRTLEGSALKRPAWFDAPFVARVREKMRQLQGRWKSVPYGGVMELDFEE